MRGSAWGGDRCRGLCKVFASKTGAATIEHLGLEPTIELGELDGKPSQRTARIQQEFSRR
ncbi:MAG: hypothetical protein R2748_31585 [Bryobacterales bacterium]